MYAPALEALFVSCTPSEGELLNDLLRKIRSLRARYSKLDSGAIAAKEADLTNAWMDRRGNALSQDLRDRMK